MKRVVLSMLHIIHLDLQYLPATIAISLLLFSVLLIRCISPTPSIIVLNLVTTTSSMENITMSLQVRAGVFPLAAPIQIRRAHSVRSLLEILLSKLARAKRQPLSLSMAYLPPGLRHGIPIRSSYQQAL